MEPPWALEADFFVLYVLKIYFYFSAAVRGSRKTKIPIKAFYRPLQYQISVDCLM